MRIHEVDTSRRRDVNRFIDVPFKIYKDSELWVPPIVSEQRGQLNRQKHSFYKRNDAAFFIAEKDGEDVGRIAAIDPIFFNDYKDKNNTHFYLFDSIDDQDVANALFDAAAEWGRRRGRTCFRGPLGFQAADGFGMLAEGFEYRPAIGIPYNYEYYIRLTENWGFELEERVLSGYLNVQKLVEDFPPKVLRVAEKVKERYGFEVKTYHSKKDIIREIAPALRNVYNESLTHIAGDAPASEEEIDDIAESVLLVADPELLKFISKDGELVGFLLAFPDVSAGIQRAKGRLFPFGVLHILRESKRTNWLNLNGMGILPEYQGMGGTAMMYAELFNTVTQFPQFEHADVVQISEFNPQSLNELKNFGVDFYKTHHIYKKDI